MNEDDEDLALSYIASELIRRVNDHRRQRHRFNSEYMQLLKKYSLDRGERDVMWRHFYEKCLDSDIGLEEIESLLENRHESYCASLICLGIVKCEATASWALGKVELYSLDGNCFSKEEIFGIGSRLPLSRSEQDSCLFLSTIQSFVLEEPDFEHLRAMLHADCQEAIEELSFIHSGQIDKAIQLHRSVSIDTKFFTRLYLLEEGGILTHADICKYIVRRSVFFAGTSLLRNYMDNLIHWNKPDEFRILSSYKLYRDQAKECLLYFSNYNMCPDVQECIRKIVTERHAGRIFLGSEVWVKSWLYPFLREKRILGNPCDETCMICLSEDVHAYRCVYCDWVSCTECTLRYFRENSDDHHCPHCGKIVIE